MVQLVCRTTFTSNWSNFSTFYFELRTSAAIQETETTKYFLYHKSLIKIQNPTQTSNILTERLCDFLLFHHYTQSPSPVSSQQLRFSDTISQLTSSCLLIYPFLLMGYYTTSCSRLFFCSSSNDSKTIACTSIKVTSYTYQGLI